MIKFTKILLFFLVIALLSVFSFKIPYVNAQEGELKEIEPEIDYPKFAGEEPTRGIPDYIRYLYQFSIGAAGFLAMMMIIIGGIKLMSSSGDPSKLSDAKDQITKSLIGLGLALGSYSLLLIINPDLVVLKEPSMEELEKSEEAIEDAESSGLKNAAHFKEDVSYDKYVTLVPSSHAEDIKYCSQFASTTGSEGLACGLFHGWETGIRKDDNKIYYGLYDPGSGQILEFSLLEVYKGDNECVVNPISELYNCYDAAKLNKNIKDCSGDNGKLIYCFGEPASSTGSTSGTPESGSADEEESSETEDSSEESGALGQWTFCRCHNQLKGPPDNSFECYKGDETGTDISEKKYCASYELCYNHNPDPRYKCVSTTTPKCFCVEDGRRGGYFKCYEGNTNGSQKLIEEGSCPRNKTCSGITQCEYSGGLAEPYCDEKPCK